MTANINVFRAYVRLLPKVAKAAPMMFGITIVFEIFGGLAAGFLTPALQYFFDRASEYAGSGSGIAPVVFALFVLGMAYVTTEVVDGVRSIIGGLFTRTVDGKLSLEIHEKMSRLAPISFENTEVLDDINKADQGKSNAIHFVGNINGLMFFLVPFYGFMGFYLFTVKPLLSVSLLMIFIPVFTTHLLRAKVFSKVEDQSAPVRREFDYFETCMVGREYFKETRIIGAFSYFKGLYYDCLTVLNKLVFRASVKSDMAELGMKLLSLAGYIGILLLLFNSLMNGEITLSAFTAIFVSIGRMFGWMNGKVNSTIRFIARYFGTVRNYLRFMQMPERNAGNADIPAQAGITLRGVSFSYPQTDRKAVDGADLTIKYGETVAIVGENGSGKSTLVRLLTGLYMPDEGDVLYGGVSTKFISSHALYKNTSAVFQKYQKYQMTLLENIGISDVSKTADDATLDRVCAEAGINKDDASFTDGYNTMLSREFGGVDLSGGQWQRVAIARSFFRPHELIVLDEPTAAIDPIEETKIYNRFAEISKNKTAIIVTHRLGSVRLANRIFVMKQGKLVEQGSHAELLSAEGEYARLYKSQEKWYYTGNGLELHKPVFGAERIQTSESKLSEICARS